MMHARLTSLAVAVALFFFLFGIAEAGAAELSGADRAAAKNAFLFVEREGWDNALLHARRARNPMVSKTVQWLYYKSKDSGAGFAEITRFIKENPDWPDQKALLARAEESLYGRNYSDAEVKAWFAKYPPETGIGRIVAGEIESRASRGAVNAKAAELIRDGWIDGDFDQSTEETVYDEFRSVLRAEDHIKRVDRLLWEGRIPAAQRSMRLVPEEHKRLFLARIALMRDERGVAGRVNAVPKRLAGDLGLLLDRILWDWRKNDGRGMRELLLRAPATVPYPEKWWKPREWLVREAIGREDYKLAARLLRNHGQKEGQELAEALWLSGWVSLEFLSQPDEAYKQFYELFNQAKYPVSKARGAYWAARAASAKGHSQIALKWYTQAAEYPTTFYGQLAAQALNAGSSLHLPAQPQLSEAEKAAFRRKELARAVMLLAEADQDELAYKVIIHMVDNAKTPQQAALAANLGGTIDHAAVGVKASKRAMQNNIVLIENGYPLKPLPAALALEKPLTLAITRQESEFNKKARSPSDALGLMQMLPRTAKEVARRNGIGYSRDRLFEAEYNMKLGSLYLSKLINQFDDSYVKAIAAYNAGPGRVRKWEREIGEPGESVRDVINWIEKIPYSETRNYVQRVMENLQVYRYLIAAKKPALSLQQDLLR